GSRDLVERGRLAGGDSLDDGAVEREARRQGEAGARRLPEPHCLRAEDRLVVRLLQRDDLHPSTVTSPASPSTRTPPPSPIPSVGWRVPTPPGIPYSRATIAAWESSPPLSVTMPPSSGSRMLNASVVDSVTSTSPWTIRSNSCGLAMRRAGPS